MSDEENEEISDTDNNLNVTQSDGEFDKDLSSQSVAVTPTKIKLSTVQKKQKVGGKQNKRLREGKLYQ